MKAFVFTAAILASTAALAQAPTAAAPADNASDSERVICRSETDSGTRLSRQRVCRTRAQWNALRDENRRNLRSRSNDD